MPTISELIGGEKEKYPVKKCYICYRTCPEKDMIQFEENLWACNTCVNIEIKYFNENN